jgi:acetyltransferase-like isoleucine patch superfamily enzyme
VGVIVGIVKNILKNTGKGIYFISLPFSGIATLLQWCLVQIKMGYLSSSFLKVGKNISISSPNRIIGHKYISLGDKVSSLYGLRVEAFDSFRGEKFMPSIEIGNNVCFNTDCHIACINKIVIGNNVLIASRVFITDHAHGDTDSGIDLAPGDRPLLSKGPVIIGNNVWIGEGVVILPNVKIGDNCIIGANSVVTKNFEKNSVIAGIPAKIIKTLN